jgi:lipocalin
VREIDMNRCQGKWYEISRIPSFPIGKDWVNTSDNYFLNADGTVKVVYEGFQGSPQGKKRPWRDTSGFRTARYWETLSSPSSR